LEWDGTNFDEIIMAQDDAAVAVAIL